MRTGERPRWQSDGWEGQWRLGVLTPHADVGPESEFSAMAPAAVRIHAARVPFGAMASGGAMDPTIPLAPVRAFAEPPHVDDAAELLAAAPLDAIAYAFTSSAYVLGADAESAMLERLEQRTRGIPVLAATSATVEALRALGASHLALVDPPWFDVALSEMGRRYYEAAGFSVARSGPCALPSDQAQITPEQLFDWILANCPREVDAITIGGNGFRAVGVIAALESQLDCSVISANQALLWATLRAAGAPTSEVVGYGMLFEQGP